MTRQGYDVMVRQEANYEARSVSRPAGAGAERGQEGHDKVDATQSPPLMEAMRQAHCRPSFPSRGG